MKQPRRSTYARRITQLASRHGIAVLALIFAVSGTGFAATSITYPSSLSSGSASSSMRMSWVKIDGPTGAVLDQAGDTFSVRRTTNGTYEVSNGSYRSAQCATSVTLHDFVDANRLLAEIDESTSKVEVTTYLAYTNLNYDADITVMFACE